MSLLTTYFTRNDANTGWFYRPEVNFSGQVIVSFDVFDGTAFTPGSASLDVQSINDLPVRIAGSVAGLIIPEGASSDSTAPKLQTALLDTSVANNHKIYLNFSEALDTSPIESDPRIDDQTFVVKVDGTEVTYSIAGDPYSQADTTVTLTLASEVTDVDSVTIDYDSNTIADTAISSNQLVPFSAIEVDHITDTVIPVVTSAFVEPDGASVSIIFSSPLNSGLSLANSSELQAGNFAIGTRYVISSEGDTDFTSIGAADNNIGTEFIASAVGSGTGTAVLTGTFDIRASQDGVVYQPLEYSAAAYDGDNSIITLTLTDSVDYQSFLSFNISDSALQSSNATDYIPAFNEGSEFSIQNNTRVSLGLENLEYLPGLGDDEFNSQTLQYKITSIPSISFGQVQKNDGTPLYRVNSTQSMRLGNSSMNPTLMPVAPLN